MSRLDSFIRRLKAQRACLNHALTLVRDVPGPIFELGLGNGRTFDHLREHGAGREIFAFERKVAAHPESTPGPKFLFEGPIEESIPAAVTRFQRTVALIHADLGSGRPEIDQKTSAFLAKQVPGLLRPGGIILSDQPLEIAGAEVLALPEGVAPGRYSFFRMTG